MNEDPEAARAAEQVAAWAGISSGKREMIAAMFLSHWYGPGPGQKGLHAWGAESDFDMALRFADMLVKRSKEIPPP